MSATTLTPVRPQPEPDTQDPALMALQVMVSDFATRGRTAELLSVVRRNLGPDAVRRLLR